MSRSSHRSARSFNEVCERRKRASSLENANVTHNRSEAREGGLKGCKGTGSILEGGKKDEEEEEEVNLRNGINPWWPI